MLGDDTIQLNILSQSSFTQVIMHPIVPDPKLMYNESYLKTNLNLNLRLLKWLNYVRKLCLLMCQTTI